MRKLILVSALLVIGHGSSLAAADRGTRVNGGTLTVPGQFPSAVIIKTPYIPQNCMGTVLNRYHVLTAASCVMNPATFVMINPIWLRVIAGDLNIVQPTIRREERNVSRSYVHPNFNRITDGHNLAVIRLDVPFSEFHNTIEPALLNDRLLVDNTKCEFAGWGATTAQATALVRPQQYVIAQPTLATASCNAPSVYNNRVQPKMICAGTLTLNSNAVCLGNMGGGLYCYGRLAGVLAFGMGCGAVNQPGVYMDVRQYAPWIKSQFTRTDNPPPGWTPPQPL